MRSSAGKRCDVALLVDEETGEYSESGRFIPESDDVEEKVLRALRKSYAHVEAVPFSPKVVETIQWLRRLRPKIVFNLTEWVEGDRKLDAAITGLLDVLKFRYTGTGPDGLRLARDKALSKQIVTEFGVPVPRYYVAEGPRDLRGHDLGFPLIVKPLFGDGSDEVNKHSVVRNEKQLRARVNALRRRLGEPAVCEEFIPGNDLYVGLLGNEPRVLTPVELVVRSTHRAAPQFATYRLKNDPRYRARWGAHYRRARLSAAQMREVRNVSRRIFKALKLRDYARLDFRLTPEGVIYFIEANPNPDLDPYALNRSGCFVGVPYARLVRTIVESARKR
ncbi:MAG: ATP-grasp domain-containing protein [Betaproteobacteria bacterium]|nr:MAG: ATP-grasp domain-containing protein [Betaproteobacteria bacterium]